MHTQLTRAVLTYRVGSGLSVGQNVTFSSVTAISRSNLVVRTSRQIVKCFPAQADHICSHDRCPGRSP